MAKHTSLELICLNNDFGATRRRISDELTWQVSISPTVDSSGLNGDTSHVVCLFIFTYATYRYVSDCVSRDLREL
jgi:hypothetical protein